MVFLCTESLQPFETANRETMLFPQCETVGCLEHPDFKAALRRILDACKAAGEPTIIYAGTEEDARKDFAMGFDSVAYNQDAPLLIEMLKEARSAILGA